MNGRNMACFGAASFLGTLLIGAVAYPVHAQPNQPVTIVAHKEAPTNGTLTERVPYGDLSLTTKEGRKLLYHRVGQAVDHVCPLDISYDVQACMDFAWEGANPQIRQAFRDAKSGQSLAMTIEVTTVGK